MEDKNTGGMKEQRLRRQRVNRMKSAIVMTIIIWMLLSMVFCVGLLIQMIRLDHKIDKIAENTLSVQQVSDKLKEYEGSADPNDIQAYQIENDAGESTALSETEAAETGKALEDGTSQTAVLNNKPREGVPQKVYLTFDDGPSENTAKILDILKEKNVKATFFVIGNEEDYAKELYQRIVNEGHTLGMHSYSHKYSTIYDSLDAFSDDFTRLQTYVTEITGVEPRIYRFPGGSSNQVSNTDMSEFIRYLNEKDITYYDWNVVSGDATSQAYTPDELVENVMEDVVKYDTSIVLMHDASTKAATVEALAPMIDKLQSMEVELLPIDENTKLIQHISADSIND